MKKIVQSPSNLSRRGSSDVEIEPIPEPTKSQEDVYDKEVKKKYGARSKSVVEYSDPQTLLAE